MPLEPLALAAAIVFGGWMAVDGTSCGQLMLSRPLVAATLAGWIGGDPVAGAMLGLILEAFHLAILPIGAARYPEPGPPAVAGGVMYAALPAAEGLLISTVAFVLAWEWIAGRSVRWMRTVNVGFASAHAVRFSGPADLERRHLAAIGLDFGRGIILVSAGIALLSVLLPLSISFWTLPAAISEAFVTIVLAGLLGAAARLFPGRLRLFLAGAAGGFLLLLVRG